MKIHARIKLIAAGAALALLAPTARATPTYLPVVNGQFAMGQWYFEGKPSSLGGNASLLYAPAMRFTNRFSLIPTFSSTYQGTLSAQEFAGGANLFQDQWENAAGLKAVHGLSENWNLKERVGYRVKWLRETAGETWNHGLYDYKTLTFGTEIERHWGRKASVSLGYDYSLLKFPNYVSLESTQSSDLAREFAGAHVLDENVHLISINAWAPLAWGLYGQAQLFTSPRFYTDQTVVQMTGLLSSTKRRDTFNGGTLSLERSFPLTRRFTLVPNLSYGYTALDSNQNHYDARVNTFIANFYDYTQNSVGLKFTLAVSRPSRSPLFFDCGGSYSIRNYSDRVTQTEDGAYLTDKLYVVEKSVNLGFRYPLSRNLHLRITSSFGRSTSNTDYEAVYRYNYRNSDYQFGFVYDY